jgi:hypothetical protein
MSYRELLDETITGPMPPFGSVDALIARERRAQGRRRFAAAGAAAFGVVAVLVAVTAFGGTPTASPPPIGATLDPSAAPSASQPPTAAPSPSASSPWPTPPPEPDPADLRVLTAVLKAHVSDRLPGTTFTSNYPGMRAMEVTVDRLEGSVPKGSGYNSLWASADIAVDGRGLGSFDLGLGFVDDGRPGAQWCATTKTLYDGGSCNTMADVSGVLEVLTGCADKADDDPRTCQERPGAHGETIVTLGGKVGGGDRAEYRVDVTRPDGTALLLMCRNWTRADGRDGSIKPPLRLDDLVAIALDPRLAMPR